MSIRLTMNRPRSFAVALMVGLLIPGAAKADTLQPPYPAFARKNHDQGTIVFSIRFDANGKVTEVKVVSTKTSKELAEFARRFILKNWSDKKEAGKNHTNASGL